MPQQGTMMDYPLVLPALLERAGKIFRDVPLVSRGPDRSELRTCYGALYDRARRLCEALTKLGLNRGERVASMMWNHSGHLEAFFGVPCAGGILHTLNLRLHPHELAAIAEQARDRFLIIDDICLPVYEKFRAELQSHRADFEKVIVLPYGCGRVPDGMLNYEELLAGATGKFEYPAIGENDGASMCYTSGTTGMSKGVIYSHRSLVLHAMTIAMVDAFAMSHHDTVLPLAPMFHANAWGVPHSAVMSGAKLVFLGPDIAPENILDAIVRERVTLANAVPTVWIGVLEVMEKNPGRWKFDHRVRVIAGGAAPPEAMVRRLDELGIHILHLWGMTETSPVATSGHLKSHMVEWPTDEQYKVRAKQGWPLPLVELRTMRADGEAPWDGETAGEIEIRGPWVASEYFEMPEHQDRWSADGWFRTGDVGTIDGDGIMRLLDRTKDLVKSGGEWISSVDLENALMAHRCVKEACVVGLPHPKWQERPLAAVVLKDGATATGDELRAFLAAKFAKWQLPDAFVFVDAIPRTSVGKFKKTELRERFANWKWE